MVLDGAKDAKNWKVKKHDGSRLEPANLSVLRQWIISHQIEPDDLVINDGLTDWIRAAEVIELFDLFEPKEQTGEPAPAVPPESESSPRLELEIRTPNCAYHPDRTAEEICIGCGKFVCSECGQRLEGKFFCRICIAEKKVGVEPGAPAGQGAVAQIIPGVGKRARVNRFAIASAILALLAVASSFLMIIPRYRLMTSPAVGFISFLAALLGAAALTNLKTQVAASRSKQFALAGLVIGLATLILSIGAISLSIKQFRTASGQLNIRRTEEGMILPQATRRPASPVVTQSEEEREASAKQLSEKVAEYWNAGQLEQAISTGRTLIGLYPETKPAKLLEARLPILEQALAENQSREKEVQTHNEQVARQRFEHALQLYSEGNRTAAIDLLKSIVDGYSGTETAELAKQELSKIESLLADQDMERQDNEASLLAKAAEEHMKKEEYGKAAELYGRIISQYPKTPTAASVQAAYQESQLLLKDPSERAFLKIQLTLPQLNYENAIEQLQEFMDQYPDSARLQDAKAMLQQDTANKTISDGLYTFGRTYMAEQKYPLAIGRYEKLIKEYPRSQWIPQARKDYEEALTMLQK